MAAAGAPDQGRAHFARAREILEACEPPVHVARAAGRLEALDTTGR